MISCQKCDFKVPPKMRFALVKNFCPSCGNSLLSDADAKEIAGISNMLHGQEFVINLSEQLSKELIKNLVYDMSIFIKFDLKASSVEQSISEEAINDESQSDKPKRIATPISRAGGNKKESQLEAFRRSIASVGDADDSSSDGEADDDGESSPEIEDDDVNDKVRRLKEVYKTQPGFKQFGGISRSE